MAYIDGGKSKFLSWMHTWCWWMCIKIFFFPPTKLSREKLIDHYLGIKSDDPALDGTYLG